MSGRSHLLERHPALAALAAAQAGVVRRSQLAQLAITRDHIRRQVMAQRWRLIGPSVVVLSTGELTREQSIWCGVLHAGPAAWLGGLTALEVRGLTGWSRPSVDVAVPRGVTVPPLPGVRLHSTRGIDPHELERLCGLPTTSAARATIDASRWERSPRAAAGIVLAAIQQRLVTPDAMLEALDVLGAVPRSALIADSVREASGGSDSLAEVDVVRMLRRLGLPQPRRQVSVSTFDGPRRVDLVVDLPDGRLLAIEVDGPHHTTLAVRVRDAAKDAALVAAGYQVLRIPVPLVRRDPETVMRQLRAIRDGSRRLPV